MNVAGVSISANVTGVPAAFAIVSSVFAICGTVITVTKIITDKHYKMKAGPFEIEQ